VGDRLQQALDAIDAANAEDPVTIVVRGEQRPKEQAHAALATEWVQRLAPDASEALLLAARGHHLQRWRWPRSSYPDGRAGYLRWRRDLHEHHAALLAEILTSAGYDDATIERAQEIVRKKGLGRDPEVQVFEDALCLVFLETQLDDVAAKLDPATMEGVVRKTLVKMSEAGKAAAHTIPGIPEALAPFA
jgi:hypothetical protein